MTFSDSLMRRVRRRSHFQCCLCKAVGVELHHIVPQSENGADTEDNAAPLCPTCHEIYGANPTKRKFIREARDFWYEVCAKRYASDPTVLTSIQKALESIASKQDIADLQADIRGIRSAFESPPTELSLPLTKPAKGAKRRLYIRDLLVLVHASALPRPAFQVEILCMRELWPVGKDDLRGAYKDFIRRFGERTLRHLAARVLHLCDVEPAEYIDEDDLKRAISQMRIEVICINLIDDGAIGAVMDKGGKVRWMATEYLR